MVQGDFLADNSIDIELDEDAHVEAKKEPSLVEILAYKDTWRQGLDSFLSMLRERLVLLKDLLAPTGSIYVHLDWHAVHYVKVLMDEIFGYESFRNEIVWQRTTAHNDPQQFGRINDRLLFYVLNRKDYYFETVHHDGYSAEQLARYKDSDERGRFTGRDPWKHPRRSTARHQGRAEVHFARNLFSGRGPLRASARTPREGKECRRQDA